MTRSFSRASGRSPARSSRIAKQEDQRYAALAAKGFKSVQNAQQASSWISALLREAGFAQTAEEHVQ